MMLPSPILMICAGNLCRSPFAELYMSKRLDELGVDAECYSRGLLAMPGRKAPEKAITVAEEFGVDLSEHISQPMLGPDLDRAALAMVMEPAQRQHLSKVRPAYIGKVFLLSQPVGGKTILDPMGRSEETFRAVYTEITESVDAWIKRFGID